MADDYRNYCKDHLYVLAKFGLIFKKFNFRDTK